MFFFVHVSWILYKIYILRYPYVSRGEAVWRSLFFPGFGFFFFPLFEDPCAKYNMKNAGKNIAKKGQQFAIHYD